MGDTSAIEWTDATWNPVTGCTKISPGCKHCYAERITERWGQDFGKIILHPDRLDQPLRWKKPRRIFVNSMSDLFHEEIPDEFLDRVFAVMMLSNWHTFQVLTKRAKRMQRYCSSDDTLGRLVRLTTAIVDGIKGVKTSYYHRADGLKGFCFPNVWLGVSAEDQQRADERIPVLLQTPAAVRFVSLEPLLGPIDLRNALQIDRYLGKPDWIRSGWRPDINWVIVGGESGGPRDRSLLVKSQQEYVSGAWYEKEWAGKAVRSVRDQCVAAGVPFFFKQWGGQTPKSGGRLLDGREWSEYPP